MSLKLPADLATWNPEDENQWKAGGSSVAWRNLAISIPALLCGFAVWMMWGVITVQMLNLGFPFSKGDMFSITAIAGLSGATLRIPSTFFIRLCGGRNTIVFTTALLLIPALGTGLALQDITTPLWVFQLMALLSGFGGGNFASSMSNISFFFPRRMQGLALGLNAGVGNFGVTTMQVLVPLVMTVGLFGGTAMILQAASGTPIGKIAAGTATYIHNAGYVWAVILLPLIIMAWRGMNNIAAAHVTPANPKVLDAWNLVTVMLLAGLLTAAAGLWLMLPAAAHGAGIMLSKWLVLPGIIAVTVGLMYVVLPAAARAGLQRQYGIFRHPHTWVMTIIYTMTFGSFIGFSAALPLAIKVIFGFSHVADAAGVLTHTTVNPNAPAAFMYAWMGPFIGAFIRPFGGWLADKIGGALVTQISSVLMVVGAAGAGYYLQAAYASPTPEVYFLPTLGLFLLLFLASGIGNGSTFRTIAIVFDREQAGPVLGWTSAVAAYGAFIIPQVIGEQIEGGTPQLAMYGFAAFYLVCLVLNWAAYLRPGAHHKNA